MKDIQYAISKFDIRNNSNNIYDKKRIGNCNINQAVFKLLSYTYNVMPFKNIKIKILQHQKLDSFLQQIPNMISSNLIKQIKHLALIKMNSYQETHTFDPILIKKTEHHQELM